MEKFNYLFGLLSCEAARCVAGMDLTAGNYNRAREKLEKRFCNKNRVIRAHVRELLSAQLGGTYNKESLREFVDVVTSHVRSLASLEVTSDAYGCVLSPIILSRMPYKLKEGWTRRDVDEECDLDELLSFLEQQATSMEYCAELTSSGSDRQQPPPRKNGPRVLLTQQANEQTYTCVLRKGDHHLSKCSKFLKYSVVDRFSFVRKHQLCYNCLRSHRVADCSSKFSCMKCHKRHHSLLHRDVSDGNKEKQDEAATDTVTACSMSKCVSEQVFLCTADAHIISNGVNRKVRVLFDCGSQKSFVLKETSKLCKLPVISKQTLKNSGFGQQHVKTKSQQVDVTL